MCGEFFFILLCFSQNTFNVSAHLWKSNSINCASVVLPWRCKLFVKEKQNYFKNKTKISKPTNHHYQKKHNCNAFYIFKATYVPENTFLTCTNLFCPPYCLSLIRIRFCSLLWESNDRLDLENTQNIM